MNALPETNDTLVIRTDFSDTERWKAVRKRIETPDEDGFLANVDYLDDIAYQGATVEQVLACVPEDYPHALVIIADTVALASQEMPLLVLGLGLGLDEEVAAEVRVVADSLWSIENNISLANMDFEEFTGAVDDDGVFRGF